MKRDFLYTTSVSALVVVSQLLIYKAAAHHWGPVGFAEYAVARRAISVLHPLSLIGLAVSVPRYIARIPNTARGSHASYLWAAVIVALGGTLFLAALMIGFELPLAALIFGAPEYGRLLQPMAVLLLGLALNVVCFGYLRGRFSFVLANSLQLLNLGVVPLILFLMPDQSVTALIAQQGIATVMIAGAVLTVFLVRAGAPTAVLSRSRELLGYGSIRVPGELLHMGLLSAPMFFVTHVGGVAAAGHIAFAMQLIGMFGVACAPIGLVLLPNASKLASEGQYGELRRIIRRIALWVSLGAAVVTAVLVAAAGAIIQLYLGPEFHDAAPIVRMAAVALIPYCVFIALRSVIDAVHERALNTRNLAIAFATFCTLAAVAGGIYRSTVGVLAASVASLAVLALLTIRSALAIGEADDTRTSVAGPVSIVIVPRHAAVAGDGTG